MNEMINDIIKKQAKQQNEQLCNCFNAILGREIIPNDYKDFELRSGKGIGQVIVYKGEEVGEIKTEFSWQPNWDDFANNSIICTCTVTYKIYDNQSHTTNSSFD